MQPRKCSKNSHGIFSTSLLKPEHLDLDFDNLIVALMADRRSLRLSYFRFPSINLNFQKNRALERNSATITTILVKELLHDIAFQAEKTVSSYQPWF